MRLHYHDNLDVYVLKFILIKNLNFVRKTRDHSDDNFRNNNKKSKKNIILKVDQISLVSIRFLKSVKSSAFLMGFK